MGLSAREVKKVHTIRRKLGLDDEVYHALLVDLFGVASCKGLSKGQYLRLLDEFRTKGWEPERPRGRGAIKGKPNLDDEDRGKQFRKVEALLAEAGRPWAYADAMAQRICKVERVAWCRPGDLSKIIAALMYDQRRRERRNGAG